MPSTQACTPVCHGRLMVLLLVGVSSIVMALTIQTLFGISYKAKHCKVPEDLLVKEEETQEMFLKIRPTHVG